MAPNKRVYLDNAATGLFADRVLDSVGEYVALLRDETITSGDKNLILRGWLDKARTNVARLIHCSPGEIALIENTTHGLGLIADIVELRRGDNVLICDLEYQASYLCLRTRQKRAGFEIRPVRNEGGIISADIFRRYIDRGTRLIVLSAVQEINGFRANIEEIAALCREYGCLLAVDGIQEVGALQVDVKAMGCDFYCAGGKKWLGNPFGMGFLYVREALIGQLDPGFEGYYNIELPEGFGNYMEYIENPSRTPFDDCPPVKTASKYELGGYKNYTGALGLATAVELLLEIGPERIEEHILHLNRYLTAGLRRLGIEPVSSDERRNMSSAVVFNFGLEDGRSVREKLLERCLYGQNIFISLRCAVRQGGLRVSFHHYSTEEELDTLIVAIGRFLKENNI